MPRDGSGVYTLPAGNPVVTNTVIASVWANTTLSDIAAQLNNVFTRDGLLGPTGPFKITDGTVAAPGLAFNSEPGLGWYRESAGKISMAEAGSKVYGFDASAPAATTLGIQPRAAGTATLALYNAPVASGNYGVLGIWMDATGLTTIQPSKAGTGLATGISVSTGTSSFSVNTSADLRIVDPAAGAARLMFFSGTGGKTIRLNSANNTLEYVNGENTAVIGWMNNVGSMSCAGNFTAGTLSAGPVNCPGFQANASEQSVFMYGAGGSANDYRLYVQLGTGNVMMNTNGAIRWTQTFSTFVLAGAISAWKAGGGPWSDTSDERIKEDVQPFTQGLDAIVSLEPVSFKFKPETGRGDGRFIRLIAQQAKVGFPELVEVGHGEAGELKYDDMHSLNEGPVLWALVNAVKTLNTRLKALEMIA